MININNRFYRSVRTQQNSQIFTIDSFRQRDSHSQCIRS